MSPFHSDLVNFTFEILLIFIETADFKKLLILKPLLSSLGIQDMSFSSSQNRHKFPVSPGCMFDSFWSFISIIFQPYFPFCQGDYLLHNINPGSKIPLNCLPRHSGKCSNGARWHRDIFLLIINCKFFGEVRRKTLILNFIHL